MPRKIITLCVAVLLILTCALTAFAQGFDPERTGSISVTLAQQQKKTPIAGAELRLYHVATVGINSVGQLNYRYTKLFAETGIPIDDPDLAIKLDTYLSELPAPATTLVTDQDGSAVWTELPLGLYFIRQANTVEGFAPCTPFFVTLPAKGTEGYVYDVNASPKTEVAKLTEITIKKVWNTDASTKTTDSVTVKLLRDENVVVTAILSEENSWQATYTDMPESDGYSIKEIDVPKGFTATYSKTGYVFTVTNTSTLAQTGQLIWPIPVLAVGGMLLIALGVILLQKKRKTNA